MYLNLATTKLPTNFKPQKQIKTLLKLKLILISTFIFLTFSILTPTITKSNQYINLGQLDYTFIQENQPIDELNLTANPGETIPITFRISNFSLNRKTISLSSIETYANGSTTTPIPKNNQSNFLKNLKHPQNYLTLDPGESKIITSTLQIPKTAGIGTHNAAIILNESNNENDLSLQIEHGLKFSIKIEGTPNQNISINQISITENSLNFKISNLGNTHFSEPINFIQKNLFNQSTNSNQQFISLEPNETKFHSFDFSKPFFFPQTLIISSTHSKLSFQTTHFPIPFTIFITILTLTILFTLVLKPKTKHFKTKKHLHFTAISLITLASTIFITNQINQNFKTDLLSQINSSEQNIYELTIKWGKFTNSPSPKNPSKTWKGKIEFTESTIEILETLNLENNDTIDIVDTSTLQYDLTTAKDDDGITLLIKSSNQNPSLKLIDEKNNSQTTIPISDITKTRTILKNGLNSIQFTAKLISTNQLPFNELTNEISASPELNLHSSPTESLSELTELIPNLSATPEIIAGQILESNYVEETIAENSLFQFKSSHELISALSATPEIISELSASPNLNFIFIPSTNYKFPPTQFSFENKQTLSLNLGSYIFVHNKSTPFNVFISATQLQKQNNPEKLSNYNLTIDPGTPQILSKSEATEIIVNSPQNLTDPENKIQLINIQNPENQTIFILNPTLNLTLPKSTPPGIYKTKLTITTL